MDYQNQGNNKNTVRSCRKSQIKQYTLFLISVRKQKQYLLYLRRY